MDKRGLIEELLKLASEHRAMGLKSKLSPEPAEMMEPEAPEAPMDVAPEGDEPDGATLQKLLELLGGDDEDKEATLPMGE